MYIHLLTMSDMYIHLLTMSDMYIHLLTMSGFKARKFVLSFNARKSLKKNSLLKRYKIIIYRHKTLHFKSCLILNTNFINHCNTNNNTFCFLSFLSLSKLFRDRASTHSFCALFLPPLQIVFLKVDCLC